MEKRNKWIAATLCGALALSIAGCGAKEENKVTISWNDLSMPISQLNEEYTRKMDEINKQKQAEQEAAEKAKAEAEAAKAAKSNPKPNVKKEAVKQLPSSTETALKKDRPTVEGIQEYTPSAGALKDGDIKYENGKKYEYNEVTQNWAEKFDENSGEIKQGETQEEIQEIIKKGQTHGY